jgi:hypothetical protein
VDVATTTGLAHEAAAANALPRTSLADPSKSRARSSRHEGTTPLGDWKAATLCPSCRGHGRGARHQEGPGRPACSHGQPLGRGGGIVGEGWEGASS